MFRENLDIARAEHQCVVGAGPRFSRKDAHVSLEHRSLQSPDPAAHEIGQFRESQHSLIQSLQDHRPFAADAILLTGRSIEHDRTGMQLDPPVVKPLKILKKQLARLRLQHHRIRTFPGTFGKDVSQLRIDGHRRFKTGR